MTGKVLRTGVRLPSGPPLSRINRRFRMHAGMLPSYSVGDRGRSGVASWSDSYFLSYVLTHATETSDAMFTPMQLDRLCRLAGVAQPRVGEVHVNGIGYPVIPPTMAKYLVTRARTLVAEAK